MLLKPGVGAGLWPRGPPFPSPSGIRSDSEHLQMRSPALDVLTQRGATWRDTSSHEGSPVVWGYSSLLAALHTRRCLLGRALWGGSKAAPSSAQLSATLAPRKTNRLPASSKFSLCPRSLSPSLQQMGAFSWRDSSPQWGVRASDPRRLAACARKPGTRVGRQGSPESLCPSNNRTLDERGLDLFLSNPQLLQNVSRSPGGLRNRTSDFWGYPRLF